MITNDDKSGDAAFLALATGNAERTFFNVCGPSRRYKDDVDDDDDESDEENVAQRRRLISDGDDDVDKNVRASIQVRLTQ